MEINRLIRIPKEDKRHESGKMDRNHQWIYWINPKGKLKREKRSWDGKHTRKRKLPEKVKTDK